MKQKINWTNHLIELLVVVIGITIAFMLENGRQERADRELEQKYMLSYKADLQFDKTNLDSIITSVQNKIYLLRTFLGDIGTGVVKQSRAEEIIAEMMSNHSFFPKTATYESVKNSGGMNVVSDYEIKEAIVSYYTLNEELRLKEQVFFDYLQAFVLPFTYKSLDFISGKIIKRAAINNIEFNNIVAGYYALTEQNFKAYREFQEANKNLFVKIENWLKKS